MSNEYYNGIFIYIWSNGLLRWVEPATRSLFKYLEPAWKCTLHCS